MLYNVPQNISPEILYALARCGHGDSIVIADANFPSDSVAISTTLKVPLRMNGSTSEALRDILCLMPLDQYMANPVVVMDRVPSDKEKNLQVPAYGCLAKEAKTTEDNLEYKERFAFYEAAKTSFCVIQTNDRSLYANAIIYKGVIS
jgi:L-fucose mutarotase